MENKCPPNGVLAECLLDRGHGGLCDLEGSGIFKKNSINVAHIPTLMLAIGYPIYWAEMISGQAGTGMTSFSSFLLFACFAIFVLCRERRSLAEGVVGYLKWFLAESFNMRITVLVMLALVTGVLLVAAYEAFLPIHLMQEGDALNYHYSLTRQHLIIQSFAHIPWSAFDLYILPVDFALAPFWFATQFPNKIPQFIFLIGLMLICFRLIKYFSGQISIAWVLFAAFLVGSHGHGIQFGTAMLDLVNCYLFVAMLDSFLTRTHWLFIVEASFYFWSKPFVPIQTVLVLLAVCLVVIIGRQLGFRTMYWDFFKKIEAAFMKDGLLFLKECLFGLFLMTLFVAGPFIAKSIYYVGTPLFPFAPGLMGGHHIPLGSRAWESLAGASDICINVIRNSYGHGRSLVDFIKHFWLIAVPSNGVNNAFDYPLGLSYLLALGSFLVCFWVQIKERKISVLSWFVVIFWASWFLGSQQSRWLYLPLILMFLLASTAISKPSKPLLGALIMALFFNFVSLARSYSSDFKKFGQSVVREQDKALVKLSDEYVKSGRKDYILLNNPEVAYARFPVVIREENLPNVVAF